MRSPEALCRYTAQILVETLCAKGMVRLGGERHSVTDKVAAALIENFRQEAALEKEAERLAEEHAQESPGADQYKVVQLIKRRLAEENDFAL